MPRTVTSYGREIEATETTPLTIGALAQYLGLGRAYIYGDLRRGYVLEYGTVTTAAHYRAWMRANPRIRKAREATTRLERELQKLR